VSAPYATTYDAGSQTYHADVSYQHQNKILYYKNERESNASVKCLSHIRRVSPLAILAFEMTTLL